MGVELQNIDCNCNNCKFMLRDSDKFKKSLDFHERLQKDQYHLKVSKNPAIKHKPFQFDKSQCRINYGYCDKFKKDVSFIPNTCQLHTQICFINRNKIA